VKTVLVAEIGINHNGSMEITKKLIDAAKMADCRYVKFQKRTVDLVYSKEELDKYRESPWGTTNRQQKEGLELSREQYQEIDAYCKLRGIGWFASPWDIKSIEFLSEFDLPFLKVASAKMTDEPFLEAVAATGKKVIVSTGMISKQELDRALYILGDNVEYILMCTSTYPSKVSDINMRRLISLGRIYPGYRIGFSNHSPGLTFISMAVTLGAEMIEYHVTLDRSMYGSDQASSIEIPGMLRIAKEVSDIELAWGTPELRCLDSEKSIRDKLMVARKLP